MPKRKRRRKGATDIRQQALMKHMMDLKIVGAGIGQGCIKKIETQELVRRVRSAQSSVQPPPFATSGKRPKRKRRRKGATYIRKQALMKYMLEQKIVRS